MPIEKQDTYPVIAFTSGRLFETWMEHNHRTEDGICVKIAKSSTGIKSINYAQALEIALCYGWIEGRRQGVNDIYFIQKFTPRKSNSPWTLISKKKVMALIKSGKRKESGLAVIEAAKRNGQWE